MDKSTVNFVNLTKEKIKIKVIDKDNYILDGKKVDRDFFVIEPGEERRLTNNKDGKADINVRVDLTGYDFGEESIWKFNTEFGGSPRQWWFSSIKEQSNRIQFDANTIPPTYDCPPNEFLYASSMIFDRNNPFFDESIWANYGAISSATDVACLENAGSAGKPVFVTRWFGNLDYSKFDLVIQDI